jgi:hypothetical protein
LLTNRRAPATRATPLSGARTARLVKTALYSFALVPHPDLVPPADHRRAGGAITTMGADYLVVTAIGEFFRLTRNRQTHALHAMRLALPVPFNRDALLDSTNMDIAAPFRITGLTVSGEGADKRVYVAHHYWHERANCVSLRVSSISWSAEAPAAAAPVWRPIFDSQPCLAIGTMWPLGGQADRSGGRLAPHAEGVLLSVGDHGFDGMDHVSAYPQAAGVSYGKILLLHDDGTPATVLSVGHRNPQGLLVDHEGRVWSTEHGPEGGDELNELVQGQNYGWPLVTYGTQYGGDAWPSPPRHNAFSEPALAFVPSIAPSQLVEVRTSELPQWTGDLLLGSLQAGMLFRVHTTGDRVVYTESIDLSTRIRDLAAGADGPIVIWDDDGQVLSLERDSSAIDGASDDR